jgi:hypothetical protein
MRHKLLLGLFTAALFGVFAVSPLASRARSPARTTSSRETLSTSSPCSSLDPSLSVNSSCEPSGRRLGRGEPREVRALQFTGDTTADEFDTRSGTAYGHANAQGAASIGAAAWYATVDWKDNPADPFGLFRNADGSLAATRRAPKTLPRPEIFQSSSTASGVGWPLSTFLTPLDPDPASEYPNSFGTPASAPHVAAVAALMLQKNPGLSPADVYNIFKTTAADMRLRFTNRSTPTGLVTDVYPVEDPDPPGFDYDTGWGFVNGEAANNAVPPAASITTTRVSRATGRKL